MIDTDFNVSKWLAIILVFLNFGKLYSVYEIADYDVMFHNVRSCFLKLFNNDLITVRFPEFTRYLIRN